MSIEQTEKQHSITSATNDIQVHLALVCEEVKRTEKSFVERGYKVCWVRIDTCCGAWRLGMSDGFNTALIYRLDLVVNEETK